MTTQTLTRASEAVPSCAKDEIAPIISGLAPVIELTEEQFVQFCAINREIRIERTASGELELMSPTHSGTGARNAEVTAQLGYWSRQDGSGIAFDSSAGFRLPNGAMRSPDSSWISKSRLAELSDEERHGFFAICPYFVVELRSDTDSLVALLDKMAEYMDNGTRLGWLLDPRDRRAYVFRPDATVEILEAPDTLPADPELPGFSLDMRNIWNPPF